MRPATRPITSPVTSRVTNPSWKPAKTQPVRQPVIRRLLVANRGEIARRIFATCRALGIETVAVHSDSDADLPFVGEADAAVSLPGSTPSETYLRGHLLVEAALRSGADAVHPGYGFLSENAAFAREVIDAGLTWVGPAPESIESMGSKVAAKKLMADAGVPVLDDLSPTDVTAADLPLLVKASAGGGGRGMRIVRSLGDVASAVDQASAEAASAFGDPTVFCEPYIENGRHVEVQVVGDTHGGLLILGERDCSIQRRHQKVVEEAPAPGLAEETRTALHNAARTAATSIGYVGAGTVEFLLDPGTGRFWFLEMNTRLQVEHPVTECVTGVDLVALQIAVAEGGSVSGAADRVTGTGEGPKGHAVEVRLYAEDPASDWQPQSGRLTRFEVPGVAAEFSNPAAYGIRVDAGFESGSEVGTHYDAMLAKVIAWAPTREQALRQLAGALSGARIHGVRTNRDLLVNVLRHEAMLSGDVSTDFFDRHDLAALASGPAGLSDPSAGHRTGDAVRLSAVAAAVALAERDKRSRSEQRRIPVGWRNVTSQPQLSRFVCGDAVENTRVAADESGVVEVRWYGGRTGYRCADEWADRSGVHVVSASPTRVVLAGLSERGAAIGAARSDNSGNSGFTGVTRAFEVFADADRVDVESSLGHVALRRLPRFVDPGDQVATGSLLAPMPGSVVNVSVEEGDRVAAGQAVLVLEAMKMQHTVSAPYDGVVSHLSVAVGDQVASGAVLAVVQAASRETGSGSATEGENT